MGPGPCEEQFRCNKIRKPVCGSDGLTYSDICMVGLKNCENAKEGIPEVETVSKGPCPEKGKNTDYGLLFPKIDN